MSTNLESSFLQLAMLRRAEVAQEVDTMGTQSFAYTVTAESAQMLKKNPLFLAQEGR